MHESTRINAGTSFFNFNAQTVRLMVRFSLMAGWLLLLSLSNIQAQSLQLVTWNIQFMGGSKDDQAIATMANILREVDIVAVQEVVAKDPAGIKAIARLADALDRTGADWDYVVSNPTSGTPGQSERYAFLWKTSRVKKVGNHGLVSDLAEPIIREPFIARFKTPVGEMVLVNFHAVPHDQQPEREIKLVRDVVHAYPDDPVIFLADWNVVDHHTVFFPLIRKGYHFAVKRQPSTLKRECLQGEYRHHAIDNILLPPFFKVSRSGVLDYVKDCNHLQWARILSDHLPVWVEIYMK